MHTNSASKDYETSQFPETDTTARQITVVLGGVSNIVSVEQCSQTYMEICLKQDADEWGAKSIQNDPMVREVMLHSPKRIGITADNSEYASMIRSALLKLCRFDERDMQKNNPEKRNGQGVIGIDLGAKAVRAAVFEDKRPVLIPDREGAVSTPSRVVCLEDGTRVVGKCEEVDSVYKKQVVVSDSLRYLGKECIYSVYQESITPQEIEATIIRNILLDAERFTDQSVRIGVFAVPVSFNLKQRVACEDMFMIAGYDRWRIITDTEAVALYQYFVNRQEEHCVIIVCRNGYIGISCVENGDGVIEVLSSAGKNLSTLSMPVDSEISRMCTDAVTSSGFTYEDFTNYYILVEDESESLIRETILNLHAAANIQFVDPSTVALGAGVFAGKIGGAEICENILLLEAITEDIGIETLGGVITNLIQRNTTIPTVHAQVFATSSDNQKAVDVTLFQGNGPNPLTIGQFRMDDLPLKKQGEVQLELTIEISHFGDIKATLKELVTGKQQVYECGDPFRMPLSERTAAKERTKKSLIRNGCSKPSEDEKKVQSENVDVDKDQDVYKKVLSEILPVFDSVSFGIMQLNEEDKESGTGSGMIAIQRQMIQTLEKMGVTPVEAVGNIFDPRIHEAVEHIEDVQYPENYIVKEIRKGFVFGDKLLRAAQVVVAN